MASQDRKVKEDTQEQLLVELKVNRVGRVYLDLLAPQDQRVELGLEDCRAHQVPKVNQEKPR